MHALRQEVLPPSGVEFATCLRLTPHCLNDPVSARHEFVSRVICNLVVARSNLLRIFEVREEPAPVHVQAEDERDRRAAVRRGTEAVEGEVEMDREGDGFINIGKVIATFRRPSTSIMSNEIPCPCLQSIFQKSPLHVPTITRFYLVREHRLHGIVTGMEGVKIVHSQDDRLERLLVSFKDAKACLSMRTPNRRSV